MSYNPDSMVDRRMLAVSLQTMLAQAGFKLVERERVVPWGETEQPAPDIEEIYERKVPQVPGARIVVFSSISRGAARPNGSDAIRVAVIYKRKDGEDKFLLSETRVNRAGTISKITARTLDRMRASFTELRNRDRAGRRCGKCNAPLFTSRQGNEVCAETCWKKPIKV